MRYSKEELISLRKAAIKSESLVTRKIKRMAKGDNGIDITGMEYDPRVGKDAIFHMSGDRLKKLLEKPISVGRMSAITGALAEQS